MSLSGDGMKLRLVRNLLPVLPGECSSEQALLDILSWGYDSISSQQFDSLLNVIAAALTMDYDFDD